MFQVRCPQEILKNARAFESGAKATALQTPRDIPSVCEPREAFGVRASSAPHSDAYLFRIATLPTTHYVAAMSGVRFLLLPILLLASSRAHGMFAMQEVEQVPIGRLFTNLQQQLDAHPDDFRFTYALARLHSMAYATNLTEFYVTKREGLPKFYSPFDDPGVPKEVHPATSKASREESLRHLTNAIELYERTIVLLKKSSKPDELRWWIIPTELGRAWCLDQSGQRAKALDAYRKTLNIAWATEVTSTFSFSEWVHDAVDDVRSGKNPFHMNPGSLGPRVCYSDETIDYLLKLLDPKKDAKEIADLKDRKTTLSKMGRMVTPILVPLEPNTDFAELVDRDAQVAFDLDGSGLNRKWGWITPKAAWLVFDPKGKGQITSALQMFGNVTFWIFWRDGYSALASLDNDGDGYLRGSELNGLALWQDRNGNGISDAGEVTPVGELGITAIACTGEDHALGFPWNPSGVEFNDGSTRPTYDCVMPSK
jgi:hypothetical protein